MEEFPPAAACSPEGPLNQPVSLALRIALIAVLVGFTLPRLARAHAGIAEEMREVNARLATRPGDAALVLRRGELHRILGDYPAARADYERARRLDPDLAAVDLCLGTMLLDAGRPAEALRALDRFLAREPAHAGGFAARGRARLALGDPAAAAQDFTRAINHSRSDAPPRPDLYLDRARSLASLGGARVDEAIRGLDEGIARLGDPVSLELRAIDLEIRRHRVDAALARVDRIAARSPRQEAWLARRGGILDRAGRKVEARAAYARALDAISALPPARRRTRASVRLEAEIAASLARLEAPGPRREARAP